MTVLHLISSAGFYGAEAMLVTLARAEARMGHQIEVAALRDDRFGHAEVAEAAGKAGLKTHVIPCGGRLDIGAIGELRKILKASSVDILHAHGYKADLYGKLASWPRRTKLVSTCHNWPNPAMQMQTYAKLDRMLLRGFDVITTPSPLVEETLRRSGIAAKKVFWINNGVDLQQFQSAEPGLRRELNLGSQPIVGFVGRLVPGKGGTVLLEAAKTVIEHVPNAHFVFAGEGPCRKDWEEVSRVLGLTARVHFLGVRKDMPSLYASMNIMVLPSLEEAMPMCLLEAMATGLPVIATNVGAVPEVMTHGEHGYVLEPGPVEPLSNALIDLLKDNTKASQFGAAGKIRIEQRYSADAMARQYLSLYRQALDGRVDACAAQASERVA